MSQLTHKPMRLPKLFWATSFFTLYYSLLEKSGEQMITFNSDPDFSSPPFPDPDERKRTFAA